jgi:hypothetical protein
MLFGNRHCLHVSSHCMSTICQTNKLSGLFSFVCWEVSRSGHGPLRENHPSRCDVTTHFLFSLVLSSLVLSSLVLSPPIPCSSETSIRDRVGERGIYRQSDTINTHSCVHCLDYSILHIWCTGRLVVNTPPRRAPSKPDILSIVILYDNTSTGESPIRIRESNRSRGTNGGGNTIRYQTAE